MYSTLQLYYVHLIIDTYHDLDPRGRWLKPAALAAHVKAANKSVSLLLNIYRAEVHSQWNFGRTFCIIESESHHFSVLPIRCPPKSQPLPVFPHYVLSDCTIGTQNSATSGGLHVPPPSPLAVASLIVFSVFEFSCKLFVVVKFYDSVMTSLLPQGPAVTVSGGRQPSSNIHLRIKTKCSRI